MTNYACNQNIKNISISQPANLVKTIWTCDTKRTHEGSTMRVSTEIKINNMYTAGVCCTLFFYIYPTVHDKIRKRGVASTTKKQGVAQATQGRCCPS